MAEFDADGQSREKREIGAEVDQSSEGQMTTAMASEDERDSELNKICCVADGPTHIYPLWKDLLSSWFSDPERNIYLATPFLDPSRLIDLCEIILKHRTGAKLEAFYVRQKCNNKDYISDVKRDAVVMFTKDDKLFLENHVFPNIRHPWITFHCKFIAYLKGNKAGVLVTSANFHANHFEYSNMETVFYKTMTVDEFNIAFINPIGPSDPASN